jgi:eukaryotic-like serine/threonine-protein kinase
LQEQALDTGKRYLGKYELREPLARGGQGEVWKAFDPLLQRYVAIKQLHADLQSDPDFIINFEREARFIASLHHPNIVQIHDFQTIQVPGSNSTDVINHVRTEINHAPTIAYMVMDFIEGPTLAHYIHNTSRKRLFPEATDIIYIFTAVSLAIDYAHDRGMIHRDIKPANIMLDKRTPTTRSLGQPVLTDFGIAKLQGSFGEKTRIVGTPSYISPEQAQGLSGDKRSDLYSLGIILYEMTTGVLPFRGDNHFSIMMQHVTDPPPLPASINPAISPALSEVILKSIAKDPDDRFQSATTMTIALAEAFNVPIPSELKKSGSSPDLMSMSQFYNALRPSPQTAITAPHVAFPITPISSTPRQQGSRRKSLFIGLIALLIVLVVGSGALYSTGVIERSLRSAFQSFASSGTPTPAPSNSVVGHVDFVSSPNAPPGTLDEVKITLHGIPDAPAGETYYAWLEYYSESVLPIHWALSLHNGSVTSPPHVDQQHQNLLTDPMPYLFLITLQSQETSIVPTNGGLYYATISQSGSSFNIMSCPQNSSNNPCIV